MQSLSDKKEIVIPQNEIAILENELIQIVNKLSLNRKLDKIKKLVDKKHSSKEIYDLCNLLFNKSNIIGYDENGNRIDSLDNENLYSSNYEKRGIYKLDKSVYLINTINSIEIDNKKIKEFGKIYIII